MNSNTRKKLSIIGTVGIPAKYGGFETLAENLVKHLSKDFEITVYCTAKAYKEKLQNYLGAKLKHINLNANGISSIFYDIVSIVDSVKYTDILLILGVSGCIILPFVKLFFKRKKIIVNIDGLEWKRDKWNIIAKLFLKLSEYIAVNFADIIVADNYVIKKYVKKTYGKNSIFIPYGADHVTKLSLSKNIIEKYPILKEKYAFKVARIEPENNIDIILEAFRQYDKLNLIIIGNWNASKYGQLLKKKYSQYKNIFLFDPIYDLNILDQFRSNCYIYVHGHSAGGTNPSLVEAMYLARPVIAFDVDYNRNTTLNNAIFFKDLKDLLNILENLNMYSLDEIASNLKKVSHKLYKWKLIANSYKKIIN